MRTFTQKLAFLLMTLLWCIGVQAQEVITLNGDITEDLTPGESYLFYDSGGPTGNYGTSQTYTAVLTNAGGSITINFSALATESSSSCYDWDYMLIYDDEELIGRAQTGCASATITTGQDYVAQSGTLKIEWHSDGSTVAAGWEATITAEGGGGPTCAKPESCDVTDITADSATVNFSGGSGTYIVEYKADGDADYSFAIKNTNLTSYTLTNLTPNTSYSVRVKSVCEGTESGYKTASFKTLIGLPYAESLGAQGDWLKRTGLFNPGGTTTLTSGGTWQFGARNGVLDSNHAYMNLYGTSCKHWIISPIIPLPADDPALLSFSVALTDYNNDDPIEDNTAQQDDKFIVLITTDGGETWNVLQQWDNAGSPNVYNQISPTGDDVEIDLSAYAGLNIQIAFYGESTASGGDNDIHVGHVLVDRIPTCLKPTNLHEVEAETSSTSLQVAWTANSGENAWRVQYKPSADAEAEWITEDVSSNPFTINGLEPFTNYSIRVAAVCSGTDFTDYGKPIVAKTATGVPYAESFDTTALPGEWKRYEVLKEQLDNSEPMVPVSAGWDVAAANGVFPSANRHLVLKIDSTNCRHWILSPTIEMEAGYQLTFDLALTKADEAAPVAVTPGAQNDDKFIVFISSDGGENWNPIRIWDNEGEGDSYDAIKAEGQTATIDLRAYAGQSIRLAFYGESQIANTSNNLHIANVKIDLIPACSPASSLVIEGLTHNSASAVWTFDDAEASWNYGFIANPGEGFAPLEEDFAFTSTSQEANMPNLLENTDYAFFLRHDCGESKSEVLIKNFKTFPAPKVLPYEETFEAMKADSVAVQWDNSASATETLASSPHYVWGVYSYSGNKMLRMNNFSVRSGSALINSPRIVLPSDEISLLKFDYAHTATCGNFSVRISADNGKTWSELGSYGKTSTGTSNSNPGEFTTVEKTLEDYLGQTVILQFYANANYGSGAIFIDNVSITQAPACMKPSGLAISSIDSESASLSWNEETDGSSWIYALALAEDTVPADSLYQPIDVNSIDLADLTANTSYVFYLRKACAADLFSEEFISIAFTTLPAPMAIPFSENFNALASGIPEFWNNDEGSTTSASNKWNRYVITATSDTCLRFNSYSNTNGNTNILATPRIALTEDAMLSFRWKNPTGGSAQVLISADGGATRTVLENQLTGISDWTDYEINLADYTNEIITIYFLGISNYGNDDAYLYLDDVEVKALPSCMKPTALAVVDSTLTSHSIQIDWNPGLNEKYWFVQYKKSSESEWSYVSDSVKAHPYTIDGLNPATVYNIRVAAWCNTADSTDISEYSAIVSHATECAAVEAISEDFENELQCWNFIMDDDSPLVLANYPQDALSGGKFLYAYSEVSATAKDQYIILPELNSLEGKRLKFYACKDVADAGTANLVAGVLEDPADASTFASLDTVQLSSTTYAQYVIPFSDYAGEGKYVAFKLLKATSTITSIRIEDVVVEAIPTCVDPASLHAIADSISESSVVLAWTPQGSETNWLVRYKLSGAEEWADTIQATSDTLKLEGLARASSYEAQVAAWCDPADPEAISPYSGSALFATSCGTYSITEEGVFSEGFEGYVGVAYNSAFGVVPTCWETGGTTTYPAPHVVVDGQYAFVHDGQNGLNFCGSANSYAYAALPQFAEPLNSLQIGFWAKVESASYGNLLLGYVTSDDVSTFQTIATVPCTTTMKKYEYTLDTVPAAATRLVFVWNYTGTSYYSAGIDDIEVSLIPSCLKPQGLEAVLTKGNGSVATLNWKAGASEEAWVVEYATKADFSNALSLEASDSTANLSGLLSDTTYYARVKAVCSATDESYWSDAISFIPTNAIIINDSTATSYYVPFHGYYINYDAQGQFIVPASEINMLAWDSITSLTFYSSTENAALTGAKFDVYVAEIEENTLSAMKPWTAMEKVVDNKHLSVADKQMVVTFDEPYQYQGGNLLIGFKLSTPASSTGSYVYWYGKYGETGDSYYNYTSSYSTSNYASSFLPKVRFDYVEGPEPTCYKVKDLVVTGITASSAAIGWTNGTEDQDAWQIAYSADPNFDLAEATPVDIASNPYALADLLPDTLYDVYVRANCGEGDYSAWNKISFRTAKSCQTPDDLAAANIGLNSATISWNTYGQTGFNLRYIQGTDTVSVEDVESPYELTGLQVATAYKVQVQAACESEEDSWSAAINFKTAYGTPFEEKFASTSAPADWARYSGLLADVLDGGALTTTTSGWNFSTGNGVFNNHAKVNIFGTSCKYWLATPAVHVSGNVQLTFDLALTKYSGTLTPVEADAQADDKFAVLISTDNGANWSVLRLWDNAGSEYVYNNIACSATGEPIAIDLSAYDGQAIKIAFYGESTVSGNGDNNLHIDNVLIDLVPTCLKPTGFSISDVKAHSAQLNWTAGDEGQSAWQIAIDTIAAFNPDTLSNLIDVIENPYVLTGLDPEKNYYVYVRANCGAEDGASRWTDRNSFRTTIACPAPTGLAAVLTPGNGSIATLNWNAGEAQAWQIEYSLNANLSDSIAVVVSEPTINLTGLTADTTYYARVKADCGELDGKSLYSAVISFKPTDAYELLLNDGTATNQYVPVEGNYVDDATQRSQFVIPAAQLESLEWDSITTLTFFGSFTSSSRTSWPGATFEAYVLEIEDAALSAEEDWNSMTKVMNEASLALVDGKMVVSFSDPYQYQGGNLMIGIKSVQTGDYASVNWAGVSASGASFGGHGTTISPRNFLPKMLINYVPGVAPACPNPKNLAVSGITDSEATFSWKAVEDATWEYALVQGAAEPAAFISTGENSVTIADLAEDTDYTFYLRRACGDDGYSDATLSVAFTTEIRVEAVPFVEDFEEDGSWKFVNGSEPNAWMIGNAANNGGEKALYISNDGGASNSYTKNAASASYATILLDFTQDGEYTFAYDWKAYGDYNVDEGELYDYLRVVLVPATATLEAGTPALPDGYIALDNGGLYGATDWQHHSSDAEVAAGQYKLVFAWFNDESDGEDAPAAVDNISIQEKGPETGLEGNAGIFNNGKAFKFLRDNKVFILVNGVIYDATGRKVEVVK